MRTRKPIVCLLLCLVVLLTGLAATGLSFEPNNYIDGVTGYSVNRSTPEDTVKSYYQLLDGKSFAAASNLYSAQGQKLLDPRVLEMQAKSSRVVGTSLPTLFPANMCGKYAAVAFVRSITLAGSASGQLALGVEFTVRDRFSHRWSIVGDLKEIPVRYRLQLFEQLVGLEIVDRPGYTGLKQYSDSDAASIKRQVTALVSACNNALDEAKHPVVSNSEFIVTDVNREFVAKYAPYSTYTWSWQEQSQKNLLAGHPAVNN